MRSIRNYLLILLRLQLWEHIIVWSPTAQWETRFWFSISSYPINYQMYSMFYNADAFNQELSFDTAEVTTVRAYNWLEPNSATRDQILISYFLPNLSSDGQHVRECRSLQSTTIFRYWQGYRCEGIFFWSPITKIPDSYFLLSFQHMIRWRACFGMQKPSINHYISILARLHLWGHTFLKSNHKDSRFLFPTFFPTHDQMTRMFGNAEAFNQPLAFDLAEVRYVRAYNWLEPNSATRDQILISYFLPNFYHRCTACSQMQEPSIRTCVILETILASSITLACFPALDAVTKMTQSVQRGRGVQSQLVISPQMPN